MTRTAHAASRAEMWRNLSARDGSACHYCGVRLPANGVWTVDHVIPRSRGGSSRRQNLVLSCGPCNWQWADHLWKCACRRCVRLNRAFTLGLVLLEPEATIPPALPSLR